MHPIHIYQLGRMIKPKQNQKQGPPTSSIMDVILLGLFLPKNPEEKREYVHYNIVKTTLWKRLIICHLNHDYHKQQ